MSSRVSKITPFPATGKVPARRPQTGLWLAAAAVLMTGALLLKAPRVSAADAPVSPSAFHAVRPAATADAVTDTQAGIGLRGTALKPAPTPCAQCADWNKPQPPFRIFGNTFYVGVGGLSSILITSDQGLVLIDGDLPESATAITEHVQSLGFEVKDIKLILNSHAHFDHAGGIAKLQRMSGASVAASAPSARVLQQGHSDPDDPQFGLTRPMAPVKDVEVIRDGQTLTVGPLSITAHLTPGHTPGGTTWTWKSCEQRSCRNLVYADSLAAVAAKGFRFSGNRDYPHVLQDFRRSFATLKALPCDILLTPHPEASDMWARRDSDSWVDPAACRRYATAAEENLMQRIASEKAR